MDEWLNKLFIYGGSASTGIYSEMANSARDVPPDIWTINNYVSAGATLVFVAKLIFDVVKLTIDIRRGKKDASRDTKE